MMIAKHNASKVTIRMISISIVGFMLSYYAYGVETSKENDESYEAMCDISERISCTKAFMSEYGEGFGFIPKDSMLYFPNCIYGLVTYTLLAVLSALDSYFIAIVLVTFGVISNILSVYLAYILYILNDICLICVSMYIVNVIFLIFAIEKYKTFQVQPTDKKIK